MSVHVFDNVMQLQSLNPNKAQEAMRRRAWRKANAMVSVRGETARGARRGKGACVAGARQPKARRASVDAKTAVEDACAAGTKLARNTTGQLARVSVPRRAQQKRVERLIAESKKITNPDHVPEPEPETKP